MEFFKKRKNIFVTLIVITVITVLTYLIGLITWNHSAAIFFYLCVGLTVSNLLILFFRNSFRVWYLSMIVLFPIFTLLLLTANPNNGGYISVSDLEGESILFPILLVLVTILIVIVRGIWSLFQNRPAKK